MDILIHQFIQEHARAARDLLAGFWITGVDYLEDPPEGSHEFFCENCAEDLLDELRSKFPEEFEEYNIRQEGGCDTDLDQPPYCFTCGARLRGQLTPEAIAQELVFFMEDPPGLHEAGLWSELYAIVMYFSEDDPRCLQVEQIVAQAYAQKQLELERQLTLAELPGMGEARASLLGVLQARAEQNKNEPSYRFWDEMFAYLKLPDSEQESRSKWGRARKRRLLEEADRFLGNFGYHRVGMDCFKTPYGQYWWPFIVQVEQERLWGRPAFLEGQVVAKRFDSLSQDLYAEPEKNPYPEDTKEHISWEAGFRSVPCS